MGADKLNVELSVPSGMIFSDVRAAQMGADDHAALAFRQFVYFFESEIQKTPDTGIVGHTVITVVCGYHGHVEVHADKNRFAFQLSFFIRMIYSCLVDADFLDTEKFMDKETHEQRKGYPTLLDLQPMFFSALNAFTNRDTTKPINNERAYILKHWRRLLF